MKLFGKEISLFKNSAMSSAVPSWWNSMGGWIRVVSEPFTGAWQRNISGRASGEVLAYSAVFSCVTGIAQDVGKCPPEVQQWDAEDGIWEPAFTNETRITKLLRKPNHYQNWIKFFESWTVSKLLYGNTYALKGRDSQGNVDSLYILDPKRVQVTIAPNGDVFYELSGDDLNLLPTGKISVPAREIIHDRMVCLWHPLCGVSPIFACGASAMLGASIQNNSSTFFSNASRPSGMLVAPGAISNETALRLKEAWESNFGGDKIGRLAVLGDGLKYEAMTIPAVDAQLIDQLKWTVEDVARAFHYPMYKLGGTPPAYNNIEALNQAYYADCLQSPIENMELCLAEGLDLDSAVQRINCDTDALVRMDSFTRFDRHNKAIGGGWYAPNDARRKENLKPVKGGESPMMQQQNWTLEQLADRPPPEDKAGSSPPPAPKPGTPAPDAGEDDTEDMVNAALAVFKEAA